MTSRVPSLVSYCQRILSAHADAITCLGDDVRYDVIKPVLECCSADTLLRLEQSSPYLAQDTSDLWERLCFKSYPLLAEQVARSHVDAQPDSWRDQYFLLREAEAHRLEEVASRLRNQRLEAAERKREREVKLTDKLPPAKRVRAWGTSSQPKSLFQKTKNEATKLRRCLYTPRVPLKIPHGSTTTSSPVTSPPKLVNSRMSLKSAQAERPSTLMPQTTPRRPAQHANSTDPAPQKDIPSPPHSLPPAHSPPQATEHRPSKPPIQKRDPMASLFMPKHRTLSQLPSQGGNNNRGVPAR